ncbi:hypothetical protein [Salinicoccus roseus]|uniref:hypothetical protein n=1 Tax=Salinicoccus roseus TaxID=45670 RepID=UPI001EF6F7D7|nr:hypothetical protein [Salinicoccus roseus]MCG7331211.1 hypothetical protein [Salinicoccus roseus]
MKKYTVDEVIRMIKPNSYTYQGMPQADREDMQARYKEAKQKLDAEGISALLQVRISKLDEETADFPPFSRKSVIINAIRYGGFDGWTNPHERRER